MDSDKIARKIEDRYECLNARVKLTLNEVVREGEWYTYKLKIKKGTQKSRVFNRADDVQACSATGKSVWKT